MPLLEPVDAPIDLVARFGEAFRGTQHRWSVVQLRWTDRDVEVTTFAAD